MSFFKDFKDDLSLAVNELLPGEDLELEDELEDDSEMMVNTLEGELDIESELSKLDGLLEDVETTYRQITGRKNQPWNHRQSRSLRQNQSPHRCVCRKKRSRSLRGQSAAVSTICLI